jgi:hypothetical protein
MTLRIIDVEADIKSPNAEDANKNAIKFLKDTQYTYFLAIIYGYGPFMTEAFNQNIAGTGKHNWMFTESVATAIGGNERGSPLHLATAGISMMKPVGTVRGPPIFERFLEAWHGVGDNPKDVKYLKSKFPQYADAPDFFNLDDAFFNDITDDVAAGAEVWLYDSVVAAGLAACNVTRSDGTYFTGPEHYNAILDTEFNGTSGRVRLGKTGTRDPTTSAFVLVNWKDLGEDSDGDDGKVSFASEITYIFQNGQFEQKLPHLFNDGTTTIRADLPDYSFDMNYIGSGLRIVGLIMSGIVLLLSASFSIWTHLRRDSRVVKASQPVFLHIICFGTFLMGSAIIPLSFDEEIASQNGSSIACMAVPWLLCVG